MATAPSFDGTQLCKHVDPEIFFPELPEEYDENHKLIKPTKEDVKEYNDKVQTAKDICARCHFLEPCLEYALKQKDLYGIWGGTTEKERTQIKNRISRQKYKDKQKGAQ